MIHQLIVTPDGRLILTPSAPLSPEAIERITAGLRDAHASGRISVFAEPIEIVDLRRDEDSDLPTVERLAELLHQGVMTMPASLALAPTWSGKDPWQVLAQFVIDHLRAAE